MRIQVTILVLTLVVLLRLPLSIAQDAPPDRRTTQGRLKQILTEVATLQGRVAPEDFRKAAAKLLGAHESFLLPLSQSPEAGDRAVAYLLAFAEPNDRVLSSLARLAHDSENAEVRTLALDALGSHGRISRSAAIHDTILALLKPDTPVRVFRHAANAAATARLTESISALIAILKSDATAIYEPATRELGRFGSHAAAATPALRDLLQTAKDEHMRALLHDTITRIEGGDAQ